MNFDAMASQMEELLITNRGMTAPRHAQYLFLKLLEIFTYEGLPLTISKSFLEDCLISNGVATFYKYEDSYFVSAQGPQGKSNIYGVPTEVQIEHLKPDGTKEHLVLTDGIDCVVMRNDYSQLGLYYVVMKYALLLSQADITFFRTLVNLRTPIWIQAKDETAYRAALAVDDAILRGDNAIILARGTDDGMMGIQTHPISENDNVAQQIIEITTFITAQFYSELGINVAANVKREYVNEAETESAMGVPLITHMLRTRVEAIERINALFDLEINIKLSTDWDAGKDEEDDRGNETIDQSEDVGLPGTDGEAEGDGESTGETETKEESNAEDTEGVAEDTVVSESDEKPIEDESENPETTVDPLTAEEVIESTIETGGAQDESDSSTITTTETDRGDNVHEDGADDTEVSDSGTEHEASAEVSDARETQSSPEEQTDSDSDNK